MDKYTNNKFCTAPMLDLSDDHCRFFWRLLSKRAMLYTEMVTTGAIIYGKKDYLAYNESENPLALQLGGCNPEDLAFCAKKAEKYNYQEINLNVGCPSDRVQNGGFGASLMAQPQLVADCIKAMKDAVSVPVSVKCRIGIDELDSYEYLTQFIGTVEQTGCDLFIIHARKAWLQGLSPRENRDIPPLKYETVYQVKKDFPNLNVVINGGIDSIEAAKEHLEHVDGVMLGRTVYDQPYILAEVDREIYGDQSAPLITRESVIDNIISYADRYVSQGGKLSNITRHILGLYFGCPGARTFRRILSQEAIHKGAGVECIERAFNAVKKAEVEYEEHERDYVSKSFI